MNGHSQNSQNSQNSDDVQIAAEALESLRTCASAAPSPAASPPPSVVSSSSSQPSFLSLVSSSAAKVYNSSKSYSPRFRYSAEKIESVAGSFRRRVSGTSSSSPSTPTASTPSSRHQAHHHVRQKSSTPVPPGAVAKKPQHAPRSAWQNVLVTATSFASITEESRRKLRYFLHLLKLANTKLATTVNKLQDLIQQEKANAMAQSIASNHVPSQETKNTVNYLKQDLINTIRKVVTVISTFAGNSLPEPARSHVKSMVLRLPSNWAHSVTSTATPVQHQTITPKEEDAVSSSTTSETSTATAVNETEIQEDEDDEDIEAAGGRVLTLAKETLDMLENIIRVVDDTLEKAEMWFRRGTPSSSSPASNDQQQHEKTD